MVEKIGSGAPSEVPSNVPASNGTVIPEGTAGEGQTAPGASNLLADVSQTSENELVSFEEGADDASLTADGSDNSRLSIIQQQREAEFENYLQYQKQMAELEKQKNNYERQVTLYKDNPDTVKRFEGKLKGVEAQIKTLKVDISDCEKALQDLMTQYNNELASMAAASYAVPSATTVSSPGVSGGVQGAVAGSGLTAGNVVYSSGTSSGSLSPSVASALDRRLGNGFSAKCQQVAGYLGCNVNDLLAMMYSESGLQTTARNSSSNAIGLIQFMPSTLKGNGYTTEQVARMSAVQQLDVVADIFMKAKTMAGYGANEKIDGGTLYAINWLPAYARRDTIATRGGSYYSSGLDMDKNGAVTKGDLTERLRRKYNEMLNNI